MTLNTKRGLGGEYVPNPVAHVSKQVEDYEASGASRAQRGRAGRW